MTTEVNGITVTYKNELEHLEAEAEATWIDFVAAAVGTKEEDVAREVLRIARANLAAHVEGREPAMQCVDEKTEPTFNFEDDFGDMATLAATATESQVGGDNYYLESTFAKPWLEDLVSAVHEDTLTSATSTQVGGDHYTKQGIQPLESTFANFGYSGVQASIYTKVNKYLTRDKGTHRLDLAKAIHVLQMQVEYYDMSAEGKEALDALEPRHNLKQPIEGNK